MSKSPFLDIPPLVAANGTVHLPGSKSISNRVLLLAGLCSGSTTLHGVLDSDDTRVMLAALERIGCSVSRQGTTARITGIGGALPAQAVQEKPIELFLGNAGTAMRPLTAALAMLQGRFLMTGVPRMYERPIGDLVDGLRQLGCDVEYAGTEGYPPLRIGPRAKPADGRSDNGDNSNPSPAVTAPQASLVRVRGDVSSQFLTALLMAAPLAGHTITFEIEGELISKPYIAITLNLLQRFGVTVQRDSDTGWKQFTIAAGAAYSRLANCMSRPMRPPPATSSRSAPLLAIRRKATASRCRAWAPTPSRATSASSRRLKPWAPRSAAHPTASPSSAASGRCAPSTWTATTFPMLP